MLKDLAPITAIICSWCAGLTEPITGKFINILVIALAVIMSSIGSYEWFSSLRVPERSRKALNWSYCNGT